MLGYRDIQLLWLGNTKMEMKTKKHGIKSLKRAAKPRKKKKKQMSNINCNEPSAAQKTDVDENKEPRAAILT